MRNNNDDEDLPKGAWITAIIGFFGTWLFAFVLFNFFGLVLGWIPALIVAVVLFFTAPLLYAILWFFILMIFISILIAFLVI